MNRLLWVLSFNISWPSSTNEDGSVSPRDLSVDLQSHDDRWLCTVGDSNLCLCSKMVSGVRCERPP